MKRIKILTTKQKYNHLVFIIANATNGTDLDSDYEITFDPNESGIMYRFGRKFGSKFGRKLTDTNDETFNKYEQISIPVPVSLKRSKFSSTATFFCKIGEKTIHGVTLTEQMIKDDNLFTIFMNQFESATTQQIFLAERKMSSEQITYILTEIIGLKEKDAVVQFPKNYSKAYRIIFDYELGVHAKFIKSKKINTICISNTSIRLYEYLKYPRVKGSVSFENHSGNYASLSVFKDLKEDFIFDEEKLPSILVPELEKYIKNKGQK